MKRSLLAGYGTSDYAAAEKASERVDLGDEDVTPDVGAPVATKTREAERRPGLMAAVALAYAELRTESGEIPNAAQVFARIGAEVGKSVDNVRTALVRFERSIGVKPARVSGPKKRPIETLGPRQARDRASYERNHGKHHGVVHVTLSVQSIAMLDELAAFGIYGSGRAEVASRFVDKALERFIERPILAQRGPEEP